MGCEREYVELKEKKTLGGMEKKRKGGMERKRKEENGWKERCKILRKNESCLIGLSGIWFFNLSGFLVKSETKANRGFEFSEEVFNILNLEPRSWLTKSNGN